MISDTHVMFNNSFQIFNELKIKNNKALFSLETRVQRIFYEILRKISYFHLGVMFKVIDLLLNNLNLRRLEICKKW